MKRLIFFFFIFALVIPIAYCEEIELPPEEIDYCCLSYTPTYIEFDDTKIVLGAGEIYKPILYTDANPYELDFYSKNKKVADVSIDGTIIGKKKGSTKIVVEVPFGGPSATVKVEIKKAPKSISLPSSIDMYVGELSELKVRLSSGSASKLTWQVNDKRIIEAEDALVYAKKAGTAYVTATTFNGKTATCKVNVYKRPSRIYLNKSYSVKKDKYVTIVPRFKDGEHGTYTIYSADSKIVKVSGTKIKGRKRGSTTIIVRTNNGIEAEALVYVY